MKKIVVKEINPSWNDYDKSVAECQLYNYGKIYLDEYGCPVDNVYETDEIYLLENSRETVEEEINGK